MDHRDRLVCVAVEVPERTSEYGSCSAGSADAMNNDAFAALHTPSGKACRVQDAVALARHIEWLTATDKILKQDLMRGQRGRVVVARVKTNELLEPDSLDDQTAPASARDRDRQSSQMTSRTAVAAAVTNFNASSITFRGRDGKCLDHCTRRGWSIPSRSSAAGDGRVQAF